MGGKTAKASTGHAPIGSDSGPWSGDLRALSAEELARRSQQGCRASFAELVERYAVPLRQFLHHQTNHLHDAEDLVQDTFVRAYGNIDRYRSSYKFSTWLFTIARRLASSRFRSLRRPQMVAEAVSADPEPRVLGRAVLELRCLATPAIAHGRLYVRTESNLYCFGVKND